MNQILPCDWLPEEQDGTTLSAGSKHWFSSCCVIHLLLTKLVQLKWLDTLALSFSYVFIDINTHKRNLANIKPI